MFISPIVPVPAPRKRYAVPAPPERPPVPAPQKRYAVSVLPERPQEPVFPVRPQEPALPERPRLHPGPPDPRHHPGSLASPSLPRAPPPPDPPPLVGPLESAAIPPPWLLPSSAPPWAIIMAVLWVLLCASCSGSLLSLPWLLPPSSPLGLCLPAPSRVSVLLLSRLPSSHPPLPMLFPRCEDAPSGRGWYVRIMNLSVCVLLPMCSLWPSFSLMLIVFN